MAENSGYITIGRKLFEHDLFKENREFSRFEAWLDLIQLCAFEENNSMLYRGRIVKWGRGQTIASVRFLQQRWKWKSVDRVFSFLELLRSQNMIQTDKEQGIGRITLCKYDDYNKKSNRKRTETGTDDEQSPNKLKEYKELKEIEKGAREKSFYDTLLPYLPTYGKEMLRLFFDYWSEWNKTQTKMRFELKETWEVAKRLNTWSQRDNQFGGDKNKPTEQVKIKMK